jgi:hypothetical protein
MRNSVRLIKNPNRSRVHTEKLKARLYRKRIGMVPWPNLLHKLPPISCDDCGGRPHSAPLVRSQINGNNGSATNSDDVENKEKFNLVIQEDSPIVSSDVTIPVVIDYQTEYDPNLFKPYEVVDSKTCDHKGWQLMAYAAQPKYLEILHEQKIEYYLCRQCDNFQLRCNYNPIPLVCFINVGDSDVLQDQVGVNRVHGPKYHASLVRRGRFRPQINGNNGSATNTDDHAHPSYQKLRGNFSTSKKGGVSWRDVPETLTEKVSLSLPIVGLYFQNKANRRRQAQSSSYKSYSRLAPLTVSQINGNNGSATNTDDVLTARQKAVAVKTLKKLRANVKKTKNG